MGIIESITQVFSSIGEWIAESITDLMGIFYTAETGLTLIGTLSIIGLGFSIVFLIMNIIRNFIRFK